jgi:hypothetical protein
MGHCELGGPWGKQEGRFADLQIRSSPSCLNGSKCPRKDTSMRAPSSPKISPAQRRLAISAATLVSQ